MPARKPNITAAEAQKCLTRRYHFGEHVDLRNHRIHGPLLVEGESICGLDMSGCVFDDPVSFERSIFHGLSWFKGAQFTQGASFIAVQFSNDARFDGSHFSQQADFSNAEFRGVGCFDNVLAQQTVTMNSVLAYGNLSFAGAVFENQLVIGDATLMGGLWIPNCASDQFLELDSCTVLGRIER